MGIRLTEEGFHDLREHVGHQLEVVAYGPTEAPANVAIECLTCGCVLVDFDYPGEVQKSDNVLEKEQ